MSCKSDLPNTCATVRFKSDKETEEGGQKIKMNMERRPAGMKK